MKRSMGAWYSSAGASALPPPAAAGDAGEAPGGGPGGGLAVALGAPSTLGMPAPAPPPRDGSDLLWSPKRLPRLVLRGARRVSERARAVLGSERVVPRVGGEHVFVVAAGGVGEELRHGGGTGRQEVRAVRGNENKKRRSDDEQEEARLPAAMLALLSYQGR